MREKRGSLYLVTGLVLGLAIGLLYSWLVRPVEYVNTSPKSLKAEYKERYRILIASAYLANGDLVRAKARLELLNEENAFGELALQAQEALAEDRTSREAQALGILLVALGQESGAGPGVGALQLTPGAPSETSDPSATPTAPDATQTPTASPMPPTETNTPAPTATMAGTASSTPDGTSAAPVRTSTASPTASSASESDPQDTAVPTHTLTPTPAGPFALDSREEVCSASISEPLIQVQTIGADGEPVPGVEIIVTWTGGEEHFFTGLKPELGLGYADFSMTPGVTYSLRLAEGGQPVTELTAEECPGRSGQTQWGAWLLTFSR